METIEYRDVVDKSTWGDGPWRDEPDKMQWRDEETGLPCLIVRGPSGALCGYVGVDTAHPLHGKGWMDDVDFDVHGGITFTNGCGHDADPARGICHIPAPGEPDDVWWFGFDCAHSGDRMPERDAVFRAQDWQFGSRGVYRDLAYVRGEVRSLARQVKARA